MNCLGRSLLLVTCLWHTTLMYKQGSQHLIKYVDLVKQPKIGTKVHDNGLVWKVKETQQVCHSDIVE